MTELAAAVPRSEPPARLRVKNILLGRPLRTADLAHQRIGKPTALAVFASDNLSSSAYATEQILHVLVPAVGVAAFSLVVPVTIALLVVLAFLILSYRQTIRAYPSAGGAYVVTKDNFGEVPAQFAGAALLIDYVLTVSVSVAAGTAAITSPIAALRPYSVEISVGFIAVIAYGNLRGVRESGRMFAVPTYFFISAIGLLLAVGFVRLAGGQLPVLESHREGLVPFGAPGLGLLQGASLLVVLRAFSQGGAAVTGVEAISNGVSAFRVPEWKNARSTLVIMGASLGAMFLGLSVFASQMHVAPFESETPTVISQIGKLIFGGGVVGGVLYYGLQVGTTLILVLAANTSFADFPRLASIAAADSFLPRWLTKRGHRLVFSNGIIALAIASSLVVVLTGASVNRLIPLYAVGVFTSFTFSQAGMTKHHVVHKEPGWRKGVFINGFGALLTFVVLVNIAITRFKPPGGILGAWVVIVAIPLFVYGLVRTNRAYRREQGHLHLDIRETFRPPLPRHRVVVLVGKLDRATLAALQYARQLRPLSTVALHVAVDPSRAEELRDEWSRVGVPITLELLDCPHRDLVGAVEDYVRDLTMQPGTEVSVLMPMRRYSRPWHRLLHDADAQLLTRTVGRLPHVNLTVVPFRLGKGERKLEPVG